MSAEQPRRLPASFLQVGTSSFVEFVGSHNPSLLPSGMGGAGMPIPEGSAPPHGTTIVAVTYAGGVLVAGDRRATMGSMIASRTIEKVFSADETSIVGIAGTAGIAADLVRLLQLELSHYEKIEGTALSLEGKANRLATLIRSNLSLALRGLAVVPLFAGFDAAHSRGRVFSYDVTGGRYEEHDHHSVGSGALFARGSLKKRWQPGLGQEEAVSVAVEALIDAADDDAGTGGPDSARDIYPTVRIADAEGERALDASTVAAAVEQISARNGGRSARDSAQGGV